MKIRTTITTALVAVLALSACGGSDEEATDTTGAPVGSAPTTPPATTVPAAVATTTVPAVETTAPHTGTPTTAPPVTMSREARLALVECKDALGSIMFLHDVALDLDHCDNALTQLEVDGLDTESVDGGDSISGVIAKRKLDAAFLNLALVTDDPSIDDLWADFEGGSFEFAGILDDFLDAH